jgi:hypothetical protein
MKEMESNTEKKTGFAEGMSGAGCGSKTVHHCTTAGNEGLKNYKHPKQGSAKDCSVIAALSSIAAVNSGRISGAYPNYNFKTRTITLNSKKLPVDSGGNLVYASSSSGSWPMLWEKAFAKLISNATCPRPSTCPEKDTCSGEPDIGAAFQSGYAGLTALKEIGRYRIEIPDTVPFDAKSGTLSWPAIATTQSSGFQEDTFWKLNHDYSVIKYNVTTGKYLIRNPCGGEEREVLKTDSHFKLWGHVED